MTRSIYADRPTIGSMALKAAKSTINPVAGDLGHELMPSLVDDLNKTIASDPYNGEPFYIIIHEKKDLLLKNMIMRRMLTTKKRPFPEPNLTVFWTNPKTGETRFCWSLPHKSSFIEYLLNSEAYEKEQVADIKAYKSEDYERFGFKKIPIPKKNQNEKQKYFVFAIPNFKDRPLKNQGNLQFKID